MILAFYGGLDDKVAVISSDSIVDEVNNRESLDYLLKPIFKARHEALRERSLAQNAMRRRGSVFQKWACVQVLLK